MTVMQSSRLAAWVAAAIVFIFGGLLLFLPDQAKVLDELSVGGERDSTQGVTVESVTETTTDSVGSTTTTTTETIHRENLGSPWVRIFGSPAIVFLFRILVVAILAFLIAALIYRTAVARFTIRGGSPWMELAELDRQDAVDALDDLLLGTPRLREKVAGLRVVTKEKIRRGAPGFQVDRTLEDGTLLAGLPYPISKVFDDPNVAMSSFRIELEQRLRKLANSRAIDPTLNLKDLLGEMATDGIFEETAVRGFANLVDLGDRAVRGSGIDSGIVDWVREDGVPLLGALDWLAATPAGEGN
ncbi:MAG: hypothetical protein GEU71_10975 [Actinobacteria bacterium]|nr:hypothetical protein [Actinomycetota bacterium]